MNDISNQIRSALKKKIKEQLKRVSPLVKNYRKLDDLRIILRSIFPKEKAFDNNLSTIRILKQLLSKDDILINSRFEDRTDGNKVITVYSVPGSIEDFKKEYLKDDSLEKSYGNKIVITEKDGYETGKESNQKTEKPVNTNPKKGQHYFQSELRKFAFFPDIENTLERIAGIAKPECWAFGSGNGRSQYPILETYLSQVIVRLKYEKEVFGRKDKILIVQYVGQDKEGKSVKIEKCAINTGLISRKGNFIYLLFDKNNRQDAQEWFFRQANDDTRNQAFLPFKGKLPERADFYLSVSRSTVTYTKNVESINVAHILLSHCERIPIDFLKQHFREYFKSTDRFPKTAEDWDRFKKYINHPSQSYEFEAASQMLQMYIEKAERDAQSDDSRKVNIYRPSEYSVGFFLPLYLVKPKDENDFEVGVIIDNSNGSYIARTIYRTSMAYPRIRVMGNHNRSWLDPKKISNWRDPYKEDNKLR